MLLHLRRNPEPESKGRITLTYGQLPTEQQFFYHYDSTVGVNGVYKIRGETHLAGDYDAEDLWDLVTELTNLWHDGDDDAGTDASSILETLDIEWV